MSKRITILAGMSPHASLPKPGQRVIVKLIPKLIDKRHSPVRIWTYVGHKNSKIGLGWPWEDEGGKCASTDIIALWAPVPDLALFP